MESPPKNGFLSHFMIFNQVTWTLEQSFLLGTGFRWWKVIPNLQWLWAQKRNQYEMVTAFLWRIVRKTRPKNWSSFSKISSLFRDSFFSNLMSFFLKVKHFDSISERLDLPTKQPPKKPAPVATISTQWDVDLRYAAREVEDKNLLPFGKN